MGPALIVEGQQVDDILDAQLDEAGLEGLVQYRKARGGGGQAQQLGGAVEGHGADGSAGDFPFGQEGVAASAGIGRVMGIDDVVFVHQREPVEPQQRFHLSDRVAQRRLGIDPFIVDIGDGLSHQVKAVVDQVGDGLGPAVGHGLEVKGAHGRDGLVRRDAGLL